MTKLKLDQPLEGPLILEDVQPANLRAISAAIVRQAIKDMKNWKQPRRAVNALAWLTDPASDCVLYMDAANVGNIDVFKMLTSGQTRRA